MGLAQAPPAVYEEANDMKVAGIKPERAKQLKHFQKIGYMGEECKTVPRWAVNEEALEKVIQFQMKTHRKKVTSIFGQLKPKHVQKQFELSKVFSKGDDARSYMDARGSSADWND